MRIDLDSDLASSGSELPAAVAQIVFTASQLPGVERVQIWVNDGLRSWPDASGAEQETPLSVYDFPDFAESYAPAYPVVPPPPVPATRRRSRRPASSAEEHRQLKNTSAVA